MADPLLRLRKPRGARHAAGPLAGVLVAALAGCSTASLPPREEPPSESASIEPVDVLDLDQQPQFRLELSEEEPTLVQAGSADVLIDVASVDDGAVRVTEREDDLLAVKFPSFTAGGDYPRAVIRVRGSDLSDDLSPGVRPFEWGVDFRLDESSSGRALDDGDNLVQRGLSSDAAQFKAELDGRRPSCTVRGNRGSLIVRIDVEVASELWYRLRCRRDGDSLHLRMSRLDESVPIVVERRDAGPVGAVVFAPRVPLALGGKLAKNGSVIDSATDQFNGELAHAYVAIEP